jgi:hypothetical protein
VGGSAVFLRVVKATAVPIGVFGGENRNADFCALTQPGAYFEFIHSKVGLVGATHSRRQLLNRHGLDRPWCRKGQGCRQDAGIQLAARSGDPSNPGSRFRSSSTKTSALPRSTTALRARCTSGGNPVPISPRIFSTAISGMSRSR